jgi:Tfp pilus assembly protein PilF
MEEPNMEEPTAEEPTAEEPTVEEPAVVEPAPPRPLLASEVPTAVGLTNRGIERLNEGKVQESIDQFTKALAMDSNYAEAWERRAEAHSRLGRNDEAEEDRRRLADINAG